MKKILYLITKAEPYGGAQKYVHDLSSALRDEFEVHVATAAAGTLVDALKKLGVTHHIISAFQRDVNFAKDFRAFFQILFLLRRMKPNILHVNSSKAGGLGALAARVYNIFLRPPGKPRINIIFTAHGWAFTEPRPFLSRVIIFILQVTTVFLSDVAIAVSEHTKQEFLSWLPSFMDGTGRKVVVIKNGIKDAPLLPRKEAQKELLDHTKLRGAINLWSAQTLWIGSVAELHSNKGLDVALDALVNAQKEFEAHNVSFAYFIIGEGEERHSLEKIIAEKRLNSKVFLVGYIPEARELLSAFDLYLLPSRKEGLPFAVLEAGISNLPVIATDVGGVAEVITDHESGLLVEKENTSALATALVEMAKSPVLRTDCAAELHRTVESDYSLAKMSARTAKLYKAFF